VCRRTPTTPASGRSEGQRITPAQAAACITGARAVRNMAVSLRPAAILLAGDLIEPCGTLAEYQGTFDPIWGDQWNRVVPAIGNHEYCGTPGQGPSRTDGWASTGGGYFDYFGGRARPSNASYYSFDVLLPPRHAYERFAQQDHLGRRSTRGIRSVVSGTGGNRHIAFRGAVAPNSLVRDDGHHGMLRLKLRPDGWTQEFRGVTGVSRDAVAAGCRP
jgi:hypothetical protein